MIVTGPIEGSVAVLVADRLPCGFPPVRPTLVYGSARMVSICVCASWSALVRMRSSFAIAAVVESSPEIGTERIASITPASSTSISVKPAS